MRGKITRILIGLAGLALAAAIGWWGTDYWRYGRFLQSTDDAYLKADYTIVAPKVSGYIAEVLVQDNQPVKAGQVLARIDARDYAAALAQAKADVLQSQHATAEAKLARLSAALDPAQLNLGYTTTTAPIDGTIGSRMLRV